MSDPHDVLKAYWNELTPEDQDDVVTTLLAPHVRNSIHVTMSDELYAIQEQMKAQRQAMNDLVKMANTVQDFIGSVQRLVGAQTEVSTALYEVETYFSINTLPEII